MSMLSVLQLLWRVAGLMVLCSAYIKFRLLQLDESSNFIILQLHFHLALLQSLLGMHTVAGQPDLSLIHLLMRLLFRKIKFLFFFRVCCTVGNTLCCIEAAVGTVSRSVSYNDEGNYC